ncbi:alpha-glucosidase [Bifidobacterium sp. BRDM6]|uniref:Alpha-glucosidase n=2 Tax=Bifidobacterium choloepi TaxID=2614131 RepID=A0A6I5NG55_9BIFI|nr:TIM-barrel domain-containing protein [Bifidobacterium choloepi]NEG70284.1 alpha-glucosidase [Bifidobacterium choloepi]
MNPQCTVTGEHWRIGVLTDSLVRLEWSADGTFEDRCSQLAIDRDFGPVRFDVTRRGNGIVLTTEHLRLQYDGERFSPGGLQLTVIGMDGFEGTWHYGEPSRSNLHGTARTLDNADGPVRLDDGVVGRAGWAILDDSSTWLLEDGVSHLQLGMRRPDSADLYVFAYGHRYPQAVRDFLHLAGGVPMLPRFAFGNWWSRFHAYDEREYLALMDRFADEGIPFTTAVVDMDWHVTDPEPQYGSGWTGYTWNTSLFPDPERFLRRLHLRGLHTALNVHPRDGIRAFERPYVKASFRMGRDPHTREPIDFDITDPAFEDAYFDMHHDLEREGVDFWWVDWQQESFSRRPGMDPLWMLNHLHYLDSGRDGRWPLTFSRYAGPGSQRYPIGFSGDTVTSWRSLAFQPFFTATAANAGYGWWSHDIGGHMLGVRDEELETRWFQLGTFSPVNRLHSGASRFNGKEPWKFAEPYRSAMTEALRLRHRLVPYLYAMNRRAAVDGTPLITPMYWLDPDRPEAYQVPSMFAFGSELVVAPVVRPMDTVARRARSDIWLPSGLWFDFFDGRPYVAGSGGLRLSTWRAIGRTPAFARAGGIVPLGPADGSADNPERLELVVFPGADGKFDLYEDDGVFRNDPRDMRSCVTRLSYEDGRRFTVAGVPRRQARGILPASRSWTIVFRGVRNMPATVGDAQFSLDYDERTLSLTVTVDDVPTNRDVVVTFPEGLRRADDPKAADCSAVLADAWMPYALKDEAWAMIERDGPVRALGGLRSLRYGRERIAESVLSALEEIAARS